MYGQCTGSGRCGPNMRTDVAGAVEYDRISFKADQQGCEGCTLSPLLSTAEYLNPQRIILSVSIVAGQGSSQ